MCEGSSVHALFLALVVQDTVTVYFLITTNLVTSLLCACSLATSLLSLEEDPRALAMQVTGCRIRTSRFIHSTGRWVFTSILSCELDWEPSVDAEISLRSCLAAPDCRPDHPTSCRWPSSALIWATLLPQRTYTTSGSTGWRKRCVHQHGSGKD